jgi:hypothetical protein
LLVNTQVFIGNTTGSDGMKTPWVFKAEARRALLYGLTILFAALTPPFIMLVNRLL